MLEKLIGNTPMIKIKCKYKGEEGKGIEKEINVYVKLEYYNLTGSIKDRVVFYIIEKARKEGKLKDKMKLVEATSGNTGISLASIGAYYNYPVHIFMPDFVSYERVQLMKSYGAEVELISKKDGGFIKCVELAKKYAKENNAYLVNQFSNIDNCKAHYETTGKEIIRDLEKIEKNQKENISERIGGFISGVGTGGTLMGIGSRLKEKYKDIKIVALEPDKMPIISEEKYRKEKLIEKENKSKKEQHKIEGIGDDFVPDLLNIEKIDDIILINDDDAIKMAKKVARELGIGVGISSGANLLGAIRLGYKLNKDIITVFADDNKKYLSTELGNENFGSGSGAIFSHFVK